MFYAIAGGLAVVGVILFVVGKKKSAFKSTMAEMVTKSISQLMQAEYAEIKGVASCDQPITAPYSNLQCVYYSYKLKRRQHSTSGGSSRTWHTIDSGSAGVPFTLTDQTGAITVDPQGADLDAAVIVKGLVQGADISQLMPEGVPKMLAGMLTQLATNPMKVEVRGVTAGQSLYVLGDVSRAPDGNLTVAKGDNKFFISTKSEEQLARSLGRTSVLLYVLGAAFIIGAIAALVVGLRM